MTRRSFPAQGRPGGQTAVRNSRGRLGMLLLALVAILAFTPAAASAQTDPGDEPLPRSPLEVLLEQRAALNLSSDQLARLVQIRGRLASDNEPLVNQMMTLRTEWQQARRAARNGRGPE